MNIFIQIFFRFQLVFIVKYIIKVIEFNALDIFLNNLCYLAGPFVSMLSHEVFSVTLAKGIIDFFQKIIFDFLNHSCAFFTLNIVVLSKLNCFFNFVLTTLQNHHCLPRLIQILDIMQSNVICNLSLRVLFFHLRLQHCHWIKTIFFTVRALLFHCFNCFFIKSHDVLRSDTNCLIVLAGDLLCKDGLRIQLS